MGEEEREIKSVKYYTLLIMNIIHIGFIIYISIQSSVFGFFGHVTNWSFLLSTIYLFASLFLDTSLYFFSSTKFEKLNYYLRNFFASIAYPYCFMISIGFWLIFFYGLAFASETFLKEGTEITVHMYILNGYAHLGITIIMVIELFLTRREKVKLNWKCCVVNTVIFILYLVMACIFKYGYDLNAYVFMEDLPIWGMILVGLAIYALLVASFFLYLVISNRINRNYINESGKNEDEKLFKEDSRANTNDDDSNLISREYD